MVAVFEPGFHITIPDHAAVYGVPYEWTEKHGIRRYGFHGSSHRYISQRVPQLEHSMWYGNLRISECGGVATAFISKRRPCRRTPNSPVFQRRCVRCRVFDSATPKESPQSEDRRYGDADRPDVGRRS